MSDSPAYLLSLLCRQLLFGVAPFRARYPDSWLVWEAGEDTVATTPEQESTMTRLPRTRYPERPSGGDALGFVLDGQDGAELAVGRSAENAIVIGEASVSRTHCRLTKLNGVWHLSRAPEAMPASLDRTPLGPMALVKLGARHELILGNVIVTFHTTASLVARLQGADGSQTARGTK